MDEKEDFNVRVDQIIQDAKPFLAGTGDIDSAITSALETYNKDNPLIKVKSYTGDGGYDYNLPSDWVDGFSGIVGDVEYPGGNQDPYFIAFEEWVIYQTESEKKFRFLNRSPSASETFILKYKAPHTLDDSVSTIYSDDEEALSYLAASLCLMAIANRMAQSKDSTIGADVVAYRAKSDVFASRAKEHLKKYTDHFFATEPMKAAIMIKEFDTGFLWGGSHLTHDPEYR